MEILENLYNQDFDVFKLVLKYIEYKKNYDNVIIELNKQIELRKSIEYNEIYLDQKETRIDMLYAMDYDDEANEEEEEFIFQRNALSNMRTCCKYPNNICFETDDFEQIF